MHLVFEGPCGPISDQSVTGHFLAESTHIYIQVVSDETTVDSSPNLWIQFWRDSSEVNPESFRKIFNLKLNEFYTSLPGSIQSKYTLDNLLSQKELHQLLASHIFPSIFTLDLMNENLSNLIIEMHRIITSDSSVETTLRSELKSLEKLLRDRTMELSEVRAEFENIANECSKLNFKCQENEQAIQRAKIEKENIHQRERFTASELDSTREQLAELSTQIDTLLELNSKSSQTNISIMEERKTLIANLSSAEGKVKELEKQLEGEEERFQTRLSENAQKILELSERDKNHQSELDHAKSRYLEAEKNLANLQNQIKEIQTQFDSERSISVQREVELRKELREAQDAAEAVRTENMGMALRISKIVEEVEATRKQYLEETDSQRRSLEALQSSLLHSEETLSRREEERKSLLKRMGELAKTNQALLSEARRAEAEASEKITANEKKVTEISLAANQSVEAAKIEVETLQTKINRIQESHDELEKKLTELNSKLEIGESRIKELEEEKTKNNQVFKEVLTERDASMSKLTDLRLKLELEKKERKVEVTSITEQYQSEVRILSEEKAKLSKDLEVLNNKLNVDAVVLKKQLQESSQLLRQERESYKVLNHLRLELETQRDADKSKLAAFENESLQLKENISRLETELANFTEQKEKFESELHKLQELSSRENKQLNDNLELLKKQFDEHKVKNEKEKSLLSSERDQLLSNLERERIEKQAAFDKLKKSSQEESTRLLNEITQLRAKFDEAQEKNLSLNQELEQSRELLAQQTQTISELNNSTKTTESRISVLENRIREVEQQRTNEKNSHVKAVSEFNTTLRDLKEQKLKAEAEISNLKEQITGHSHANSISEQKYGNEITDLKQQLELSREKLKSFSDLAADKAKLIMRVTKLTGESTQAWETVRELNETSTKLKYEYEESLSKIKSELDTLRAENLALKNNIAKDIDRKNLQEQTQLIKLQEENSLIKEQQLSTEARLKALEETIQAKDRAFNLLQAQKESVESKVSVLTSEINQLKSSPATSTISKHRIEPSPDDEVAVVSHQGRKLIVRYSPNDPFSLLVTYTLSERADSAKISFTIVAPEHAHKVSNSLRRIYKNRAEYFMQRYFGDIVASPHKLFSNENVLPDGFWKLLNKDNVTVTEVANLEYERSEGQTVLALEKYIKKLEEQGHDVLASNQ